MHNEDPSGYLRMTSARDRFGGTSNRARVVYRTAAAVVLVLAFGADVGCEVEFNFLNNSSHAIIVLSNGPGSSFISSTVFPQ